MKTINSLINDFLEYMEVEKGRSVLTVKNYDQYLRVFAHFVKEQKIESIEKIDLDLIRKFRLALNRTNISKNTQNYYLIALRTFLTFLQNRKNMSVLAAEKIELAKTSPKKIVFLTDDELDELLRQPDLKTIQGVRDKAILDLFFSTGLRVSELCRLKKDDINFKKPEFGVKGKGGKIRVVFLDDEAKSSLQKYLNVRTDKSDYLFISYGHTSKFEVGNENCENKGITPRSVQRMIRKYTKAAGITKEITPHSLRHTFATDLLFSGSDLRAVQSLLGHENIATTQIYTHVTDKNLYEVHQAFHGLRRKNENPAKAGLKTNDRYSPEKSFGRKNSDTDNEREDYP